MSDIDALDVSIVEAVNASGAAYLTHTVLGGRVAMRVGFGNVLTTERHLEVVWNAVVRQHELRHAPIPRPGRNEVA